MVAFQLQLRAMAAHALVQRKLRYIG